ncbi:hypothetical protein FQZ97_998940 [compost metagenome]
MHQGAGDRHALQLPAGELGRQALAESAQAHRFEHLRHARRVRALQQQQRQPHVLRHVQVRQHVKRLEHETELFAPPVGALHLAQRAEVHAVVRDRALAPVVQRGQAVEQAGLAHARFAHDGNELTGRHREVHTAEDGGGAVAFAELFDDE